MKKTKDPTNSQRLQRDRAEAIEGIRRGLAEAEAGKGRPVREAIVAIRERNRIPAGDIVESGLRSGLAKRSARAKFRN